MGHYTLFQLVAGIVLVLLCSSSQSAPLEIEGNLTLITQESPLYGLWNSIPATQMAKGDSALGFVVDPTIDNAWGVTYLYGCTALLISDPEFVIVAHVQQVAGAETICIRDGAALNKYLQNTLLPAFDLYVASDDTRIALLYNQCDTGPTGSGIKTIKTFLLSGALENFGDPSFINPRGYLGGGLGLPDPSKPNGLAVIQWLKPQPEVPKTQLGKSFVGTLKVFFGSVAQEDPIRYDEVWKPTAEA